MQYIPQFLIKNVVYSSLLLFVLRQIHRGVPAFTVMYSAVGLGWLGRLITLPLIRPVMDRAYGVFARNRLKWTGREGCVTGRCDKKET